MKFIKSEIQNNIAQVILNRPDVHNAFNDEMIDEVVSTFNELAKNKEVRAIILKAKGKSFCAGADLNWMKSMLEFSKEENIEDSKKLANLFLTINECPKPVIGRIHGAAFGGGVGLASVCDMLVALDSAVFCLSEVKLGLIPAVISPFVIEKMGAGNARRFFTTAEKFSAAKALETGLVSETASSEEEMDQIINKWIEQLKANGPEALSESKKLIREVKDRLNSKGVNNAIDYSLEAIAERRTSKEGQEGMRAFLEKRKANWTE